jgi:hypothetical protein
MKRKLSYALLVLGLLGVIAGTHFDSITNRAGTRTADIVPWPTWP